MSLVGWILADISLFLLVSFVKMWVDHRRLQAATYRSDEEILEYPAMVASQESDL